MCCHFLCGACDCPYNDLVICKDSSDCLVIRIAIKDGSYLKPSYQLQTLFSQRYLKFLMKTIFYKSKIICQHNSVKD